MPSGEIIPVTTGATDELTDRSYTFVSVCAVTVTDAVEITPVALVTLVMA